MRPSRCPSAEHKLSTQSSAAGRSCATSAAAICCRESPVAAATPGATAATGRSPRTGGAVPAPMVTRTRCTVRGPRASAVMRRLPTPSTSTAPCGGSRARSSRAQASMTAASRSSSTLTLGISSVTYLPRGRARPSRAISTRVTVTPPWRAVASRTPAGSGSCAGANSSSAMSVIRIFPHSPFLLGAKARPVAGKYGKNKTFPNKNQKNACAGTRNMVS